MTTLKAGFRFTVPGRQISSDMGATWSEPVYRINQIRKRRIIYYGPEDESTSSFMQEVRHFERDLREGRKVPVNS